MLCPHYVLKKRHLSGATDHNRFLSAVQRMHEYIKYYNEIKHML